MAVKLEMVITINDEGEIEIKTVGMKGSECDEELKFLEKENGKFKSKTYTSEFHEKPKSKEKGKTSAK